MSKRDLLLDQMRAQMAADGARKKKKRASAPFVVEGGVARKNTLGAYRAKHAAREGEAVTMVRVIPAHVSQPITLVSADEVFLTRAGVMEYLNISEQALHDNMRRGVLKPVRGVSGERGRGRRGVSVRFRASDVEKLRRPTDAMTRAEVAAYIGKSERTVERYATLGKLAKHVAAVGVGAGGGRAYWLPDEVHAFANMQFIKDNGGAQ